MTSDLQRRIDADARLFGVTPEAVAKALDGFPLKCGRGSDWLALAIRNALYVSLDNPHDASRAPNADTRDELFALADKVSGAWKALADRSQPADNAIFDYAWHGWRGAPTGEWFAEPPEHAAFQEAIGKMDGIATFLRRAGMLLEVQAPQWRQSEKREERIWRAQCLSVVFELAYPGHSATITSHRLDGSHGNWPDFYQKVVGLAFGEKGTPNLREVLKEARRRHKANGVRFAPGIIPD
jgi:hypothetical protein